MISYKVTAMRLKELEEKNKSKEGKL